MRALKRSLPAAAAATLLASCGHTTTIASGRTLRLALTEYHLVPESVKASAGELTINVRNVGRLTHNLTVSMNGTVYGQTGPVSPGASVRLTLYLFPGQYRIASTMFSDEVLGEYGTLTVG
jgi:hypothetical protein